MIIDSETQREVLLAAINASSWKGHLVTAVAEVIQAVKDAPIAVKPEPEPIPPAPPEA